MTIRDVLVHIPDPQAWPPHLAHAARLARIFDARLTGIHCVEPSPGLAISSSPGVTVALRRQIEEQVERARAHAVPFAERAAALGAPNADWRVAEAEIGCGLAYAGAWHDVLVLGCAGNTFRASPQLLAEVVIASRMPCLVIPSAAAGIELELDTLAIAWNASIEAMRAVHAALPLLARARRLVLLRGRERDYSFAMPRPPAFDLDEYLRRHAAGAERIVVDTRDTDSGDALFARAAEAGAGVVVMGAYGRSRFSEWVLGGVTRHALWHGALPLFVHH